VVSTRALKIKDVVPLLEYTVHSTWLTWTFPGGAPGSGQDPCVFLLDLLSKHLPSDRDKIRQVQIPPVPISSLLPASMDFTYDFRISSPRSEVSGSSAVS